MNLLKWLYPLFFVLASSPALAAGGNVNFLFGEKQLASSDWAAPYDNQDEFGIMFDMGDRYWPVHLAVDLLGSSRTVIYSDGDRTISTGELDVGVRKIFDIYGTSLHPYVGGGVAFVSATYEDYYYYYGTYTNSDSAIGGWLNAGIYWTLGNMFNIGLDARYSAADVSLYDYDLGRYINVDAGGVHAGLLFGIHW